MDITLSQSGELNTCIEIFQVTMASREQSNITAEIISLGRKSNQHYKNYFPLKFNSYPKFVVFWGFFL